MHGRPWLRRDDDFLKTWAGRQPIGAIAERLGRTRGAALQRLVTLGIRARDAQGLLTAEVAAKEYGVPAWQIVRWARKGVLKAERGPRYWQIDPETIEQFLEHRICSPTGRGT